MSVGGCEFCWIRFRTAVLKIGKEGAIELRFFPLEYFHHAIRQRGLLGSSVRYLRWIILSSGCFRKAPPDEIFCVGGRTKRFLILIPEFIETVVLGLFLEMTLYNFQDNSLRQCLYAFTIQDLLPKFCSSVEVKFTPPKWAPCRPILQHPRYRKLCAEHKLSKTRSMGWWTSSSSGTSQAIHTELEIVSVAGAKWQPINLNRI